MEAGFTNKDGPPTGEPVEVRESGLLSTVVRYTLSGVPLGEQRQTRPLTERSVHDVRDCLDALRILEMESHLKSTSLTQVQRQTAQDYRDSIQELRRNSDRGFEKLEQIGVVREVAWPRTPNAKRREPKRSLVCATHAEIDNVTEAIRFERKSGGELGRSHRTTPRPKSASPGIFIRAQVLLFHRSTKRLNKNEVLEVVRVERYKIAARMNRVLSAN